MIAANMIPTYAQRTPLNPRTNPLTVTTAKQLAKKPAAKPRGILHFQQYSNSYMMKIPKMMLNMMCL
jgi:hypothetical protein